MQMDHSHGRRSLWRGVRRRLGLADPVAPAQTDALHIGDKAEGADRNHTRPAPHEAQHTPESNALPQPLVEAQNGRAYRAPDDLKCTELPVRRVLVVGSCLSGEWIKANRDSGAKFDYIVTNNFSPLPEMPPAPLPEYDFQIVQLPLRSIMHENTYAHLPPTVAAFEELFGAVKNWLSQYLEIALAWNTQHNLLTFVANFLVPQQNPMGKLLPRNDMRNMVFFIEKLNEHLYSEIAKRTNVYLIDIDQIAATFGRRSLQDDGVWVLSHGSVLNDSEYDRDRPRIVPSPQMSAHYPPLVEGASFFFKAAWTEIVSMYRTIRGIDAVKLVIFDLDDTLWRGVVAEEGHITSDTIEGWPVGLMEAACFLKKRGILLAICSRNDESRMTALFNRVCGGRLRLADFASTRINWRPKHENILEILAELHLTPHSAVFIDDNPVERAAVEAIIPHIRTLGAQPYYLRRILLWSAETQVPVITDESARRTEMLQAQIGHVKESAGMSREDFLATLGLRMRIFEINSTNDLQFPRALELLNKTNQFNSTGSRRTTQECAELFASGTSFHSFNVQDRFSHYGLVGVATMQGSHIAQFVMSCRVLGLGTETAFLAHLGALAANRGHQTITADYTATELNGLANDFFHRNGFVQTTTGWQARIETLPREPSHMEIMREPAMADC